MTNGDLVPPRRFRFEPLFAIAYIVAVGGLSVYLQRPPEVVPATAPPDVFSADRAMEHVRSIAIQAHPTASPQAKEVRDYLVKQLQSLGLNTEIQKMDQPPLENIVAVLPGKDPKAFAIMLAAHYDSVPSGPGAGDDAAGVAAILEAVRAIKAGSPLDNDLIVLITDAEERGMWGADVFVKHKSWVDRVGIVLNFEGRGNRGPAYMFETSDQNGWLIRQFAEAHPHPLATSLTYAVYKLMPNNTDLTVFKEAGMKGLNFAYIEGVENYHQPTDTPENLDKRSLQHQGISALSLARHFSGLDLTLATSEPDATYFHAMGPHLVVYSGSLVMPLMFLALGFFSLVVSMGFRPDCLTLRGLAAGATMSLMTTVLSAAVCAGVWYKVLIPLQFKWTAGFLDRVTIARGFVGIAILLTWLAYLIALKVTRAVSPVVRRRVGHADLALGGLFWWLVLTVASSIALPGAGYLFLWPLLFAEIGVGVGLTFPRGRRLAAGIGAIPALVLVPPTLQALCVALGPSMPYAGAPLAALLVVVLLPLWTSGDQRVSNPKEAIPS